jgi:hypothetical protein
MDTLHQHAAGTGKAFKKKSLFTGFGTAGGSYQSGGTAADNGYINS